MRKKVTIAERLARRPGPKSPVSKAIRERAQALNPRIARQLIAKKGKTRRGAPKGNRNAWKHGCYGWERLLWMREVRDLSRAATWLHRNWRRLVTSRAGAAS